MAANLRIPPAIASLAVVLACAATGHAGPTTPITTVDLDGFPCERPKPNHVIMVNESGVRMNVDGSMSMFADTFHVVGCGYPSYSGGTRVWMGNGTCRCRIGWPHPCMRSICDPTLAEDLARESRSCPWQESRCTIAGPGPSGEPTAPDDGLSVARLDPCLLPGELQPAPARVNVAFTVAYTAFNAYHPELYIAASHETASGHAADFHSQNLESDDVTPLPPSPITWTACLIDGGTYNIQVSLRSMNSACEEYDRVTVGETENFSLFVGGNPEPQPPPLPPYEPQSLPVYSFGSLMCH